MNFTTYESNFGTAEYTGVTVKDIADHVGIPEGAGRITFHATDGYSVELPLDVISDNPESVNPIILAFIVDGEPIGPEFGALMMVPPDDEFEGDETNYFGQQWVKHLNRIVID